MEGGGGGGEGGGVVVVVFPFIALVVFLCPCFVCCLPFCFVVVVVFVCPIVGHVLVVLRPSCVWLVCHFGKTSVG